MTVTVKKTENKVVVRPTKPTVTVSDVGVQGPPGPVGGALVRETPTGTIDGANVDFATSQAFPSGSTQLFLNGLLQQEPDDYNEMSSTQLRMAEAPLVGDRLIVVYQPA